MKKNIFERELMGETISSSDDGYEKIYDLIITAQKLIAELNTGYHTRNEVNHFMSKITNKKVDDSLWLLPPFYTDFGRNITIGKNVFINHACTFMDRGGITIGNNVLIGPKVNLITINHPLDPMQRKSTISHPIIIEDNVWIGIGATIMPNITIGKNAVVAAGSVVTKNVPANVVVAGVPAKIIKNI